MGLDGEMCAFVGPADDWVASAADNKGPYAFIFLPFLSKKKKTEFLCTESEVNPLIKPELLHNSVISYLISRSGKTSEL